ncbi:MAG: hypothetical protein EAZ57_11840, partial [Cytophagales bacterium]
NWSNTDGGPDCGCNPAGITGANVRIKTGHTVTVSGSTDMGTNNIIDIQGTGVLTLPDGNDLSNAIATLTTSAGSTINLLGGSLYLSNPATTTFNGTFNFNTGGTISSGTTFGAGATYNHLYNGGTIPTATWDATSTANITGITNTAISAGLEQTFGNFTWNNTGQSISQGLTGNTTIAGIFNLTNTGSGNFNLADRNFTASGTSNIGAALVDNNNAGVNLFNDIIISTTGTWNTNSVNTPANMLFSGNVTLNNTNANTFQAGAIRFNVGGKSLIGGVGATKYLINTLEIANVTPVITNAHQIEIVNLTVSGLLGVFRQGTNSLLQIKNSGTITRGNGVNSTDFSSDINTVEYTGGSGNVISDTYHHLIINTTDTKSLSGNITTNGNLTVAVGDLDVTAANYVINLLGNFTVDAGGVFIPQSGIVEMISSAAQTIAINGTGSFSKFRLNKSSINPVTLATNLTVSNSLDFTTNGLLRVSTGTTLTVAGTTSLTGVGTNILEIEGNASFSGTSPNYNAGKILRYTGAATKTVGNEWGATMGGIVEINKTANTDLVILGSTIAVNGGLALNNGLLQIGNFNLNYGGSEANLTRTNGWIETNGTGVFIRSAAGTNFTFPVGNATQYQPLQIVNSALNASVRFGTPSLAVPSGGAGSWFINNGTTNSDITLLNPQGTLNAGSQIFKYNTPATGSWNNLVTTFGSPNYTATNALTGTAAELAIFSVLTDFYTLGNADWATNSNNWSNDGTNPCNCSPGGITGANVRIRSGHTVTVTGSGHIAANNIIDIQTNGTLQLDVKPTNPIATLTSSTGSGNLKMNTHFMPAVTTNTFVNNITNTILVNVSNASFQYIEFDVNSGFLTTPPYNLPNLVVQGVSNIEAGGNAYPMYFIKGQLTVESGARFHFPFANLTLDANASVDGILSVGNAASMTVSASGVLTINSSGFLRFDNNGVSVSGTLNNNGTMAPIGSGGVLTINNGAIFNNAGVYNSSGGFHGTVVNGTFNMLTSGTASLSAGGFNHIVGATGVYNHQRNGGAIPAFTTWNAASNCNITGITTATPTGFGQTFGNFVWNNASQGAFIANIDANMSINGNFTMTSSGTGSMGWSNFAIFFAGNVTRTSGNIVQATSTAIFSGSNPQTITGGFTFYNLEVNNSSGVSLAAASPVSVSNALTLSNGTIQINANNLVYQGAEANLTRTSGWVNTNSTGAFVRSIAGGPFTFPVGNNAQYQPLRIVNSEANASVRFGASTITVPNAGAGSWFVNNGATTSNIILLNPQGTLNASSIIHRYNAPIAGQWNTTTTSFASPNYGSTNAVTGAPAEFSIFTPLSTDFYTLGNATWNVNGNWSNTDGGTDCGCNPAGVTNANVRIKTGNTVTVANAADIGLTNIIDVQGTGTLTLSNGNTNAITTLTTSATSTINLTAGTLTLTNPTTFNGTVTNSGGSIPATPALTFANGSTYNHARNGGVIPTATWGTNSTVNITGTTTTAPTDFGQTFGNLTIDNIGQNTPLNIDANVTVAGNFTILNTGASAAFGLGAFNFIVRGDFTRSGGILNQATSTVRLEGTNPQTITGGLTFYNLVINNTATTPTVTLATSTNVVITNILTLTNGRVVIGTNALFYQGTEANLTRTNGWIETNNTGTFIRTGSGTGTFNFPVGNATNFKNIQLSAYNNTGVRYIDAPVSPSIPVGLQTNGLNATWEVTGNALPSATVRMDNPGGATNATSTIRRWNGSTWASLPTTFNASPNYYQTTSGLSIGTTEYFAVLAACPAITLNPTALAVPQENIAYSQTLVASGGSAPYNYAVTAGTLPTGLTLNGSSGLISGTPTVLGSSTFTITVTDAGGCTVVQNYTLVVVPTQAIGNNGLYFDGVDDYAQIPHNAAFDVGTNFTFEAWIKPQSYNRIIFNKFVSGTEDKLFRINGTGQVSFQLFNTGASLLSIQTIPLNQWTHIALTYDGSERKIYINGVLDNSVASTGDVGDGTGIAYIGGSIVRNPTTLFQGQMDEVRYFNNIARTQDQIQVDMGSPTANGAVAYWNFDDDNTAGNQTIAANSGTSGATLNAVLPISPNNPLWSVRVKNTNDAGAESLRQAITDANTDTDKDYIDFSIPTSAPWSINLTTNLPTISQSIIIDGTSQNSSTSTSLVKLDGTAIATASNGLNILAANTEVYGLEISSFKGTGFSNGIFIDAASVRIGAINKRNVINDFVGGKVGIYVGVSGNNVIIENNLIGTNSTGTAGIGANNSRAIRTYGANTSILNNLISNTQGVETYATGMVVKGNKMGTDLTGTGSIPNDLQNIILQTGAGSATIGGAGAGEANIIANASNQGILITDGTGTIISRNNIYGNTSAGIVLSGTGNANKAAPVITTANTTLVAGTCATCADNEIIEIFENNAGENQGRIYRGQALVTSGAWSLAIGTTLGQNMTATATSAANNTSPFSAAVTVTAPVLPTQPIGNRGLYFDGVNDYVKISNTANFSYAGNSVYTISMWIKVEELLTGGLPLMIKPSTGVGSLAFSTYVGGDGRLYFAHDKSSTGWDVRPTQNVVVEPKKWVYVSFVSDGTANGKYIYVNGVLQTLGTTGGGATDAYLTATASSGDLFIGSPQYVTEHFKGQIDEVRIFNSVRSVSEIQTDMATSTPNGGAGYWNFEDDAAANIQDNAANTGTEGAAANANLGSLVGSDVNDPLWAIRVKNTNDAGAESLRQAIIDANTDNDKDYIDFSIPTAGVKTIALSTALPVINNTFPVILDGLSQEGAANVPLIEINGDAVNNAIGINIQADECIVRGFIINRFNTASGGNDVGIYVGNVDNTWIYQNYIGTTNWDMDTRCHKYHHWYK